MLKLAICMLNQMFLEKQIHATKNYARKNVEMVNVLLIKIKKKTKHLPLEMKKQRDLNEHQNELRHYLHLSVKINGSSRKRMSVIGHVTGQNYI